MSDDGVLGNGGDPDEADADEPHYDAPAHDRGGDHDMVGDDPYDVSREHPFGEDDRGDLEDAADRDASDDRWTSPDGSTEAVGRWHAPDELPSGEEVVLPRLADDPSWAGDVGGIPVVFADTSVADLLGSFEDASSLGSSRAVDEFSAAVDDEATALEGVDTVDGYVTPSALGEAER